MKTRLGTKGRPLSKTLGNAWMCAATAISIVVALVPLTVLLAMFTCLTGAFATRLVVLGSAHVGLDMAWLVVSATVIRHAGSHNRWVIGVSTQAWAEVLDELGGHDPSVLGSPSCPGGLELIEDHLSGDLEVVDSVGGLTGA